jgi:hypothetical protein
MAKPNHTALTLSMSVGCRGRLAKESFVTNDVVNSITSVLVPLSVFVLPNSEKLIPAIDTVVDRNFDIVTKLVEWQYEFGVAALNQLGFLASN